MRIETWMRPAIAAIAIGLAAAGASAGLLDQHVESPQSGTAPAAGGVDRAQTFTVGMSGIFERVELNLKNITKGGYSGDFVIELRKTVGGLPSDEDGDVIKSATFSANSLPEDGWLYWNDIKFGVQRGQHLAIVVRSLAFKGGERPYGWTMAEGNVYRSGKSFCRQAGGSEGCGSDWTERGDEDLWFRTFVIKTGGPKGGDDNDEPGGEGNAE